MRMTDVASATVLWLCLPFAPASADLPEEVRLPQFVVEDDNDSFSPGQRVPDSGPFSLGACANRVHLDRAGAGNPLIKALTEAGIIRELNSREPLDFDDTERLDRVFEPRDGGEDEAETAQLSPEALRAIDRMFPPLRTEPTSGLEIRMSYFRAQLRLCPEF